MIKEITQKEDWNTVLKQVNSYDFYHTYDYHNISIKEDEKAILVVYTQSDVIIALPLVLRKVPNTSYYDFTSIYGYAGPVFKNINNGFSNAEFCKELRSYFESKKVIAVFSRLHPYIHQQKSILSDLGNIEALGEVVNIDVTLPIEESRRAYGKSNKNQINKLRRTCSVKKVETHEDVLEFIDIYNENMRRLNAKEHYFFSEEYFVNFLKQSDFKTDILLVTDNETGKAIAGSMFVKTNTIVQFHLSGTRTDYLRLKPSKLFIDEMRLRATDEGFTYFNLGGGLGSRQDSLFDFKASFSKDYRTFKIWKFIVNQSVYDELLPKEEVNNPNFFPLYRAK